MSWQIFRAVAVMLSNSYCDIFPMSKSLVTSEYSIERVFIISRRPAGREIIKGIPCVGVCVSVCVMFLKRAVHHTGCFSLAFSMFYDLIAYVFSFDAVFSDLGP